MPFVLDASVASAWCFDDEDHPDAALAFERVRTDTVIVPTLFWFELRNTLIVNERHRRLTMGTTAALLYQLGQLPIAVDREPVEESVLTLARRHELSVYDAAYVELAKRERAPLSTLDQAMARAAAAEQISVLKTVV